MSEYKRFIAYFYEYIAGEKQKNTGFAKVELRNGMWRILFRLTVPEELEVPIQVFGFVREGEYLLGIPLGTMNPGCSAPEEWAWRADAPIGPGNYYFEQMNGIRIESGDGRTFFTVWDDEPMDTGRFVMKLPEEPEVWERLEKPEVPEAPEQPQKPEHPAPVKRPEKTEQPKAPEQPQGPEEPETPGQPQEPEQPAPVKQPQEPKQPAPVKRPQEPEKPKVPGRQEIPVLPGGSELPQSPQMPEMLKKTEPLREMGNPQITESFQETGNPQIAEAFQETKPDPSQKAKATDTEFRQALTKIRNADCNQAEHLLRSRQRFHPFRDDEFSDCVQIKLCDILPLQQENWQVGRSNFLQHGYYLYRHLLLGRTGDGGYILGVPGTRNPQEEYMAQMFGYEHFKMASSGSCGRRFGYWYRIMRESEDGADENAPTDECEPSIV